MRSRCGFLPGPGGLVLCGAYGPTADVAAAHATPHDMSHMDMPGMDMSHMDMADVPAAHPHEHPADDDASRERSVSCPFALAAGPLAGGPVATWAIFASNVAPAVELPLLRFVPRSRVVPTLLPRGPPSLA